MRVYLAKFIHFLSYCITTRYIYIIWLFFLFFSHWTFIHKTDYRPKRPLHYGRFDRMQERANGCPFKSQRRKRKLQLPYDFPSEASNEGPAIDARCKFQYFFILFQNFLYTSSPFNFIFTLDKKNREYVNKVHILFRRGTLTFLPLTIWLEKLPLVSTICSRYGLYAITLALAFAPYNSKCETYLLIFLTFLRQ